MTGILRVFALHSSVRYLRSDYAGHVTSMLQLAREKGENGTGGSSTVTTGC